MDRSGRAQVGFIFIEPARYELVYLYRARGNEATPPHASRPDELVVAELFVRDGSATTVPHTPAPGVIEVVITSPSDEAPPNLVEVIVTPWHSALGSRGTRQHLMRRANPSQRAVFAASVGHLNAGWYQVEVVARDRKWLRHALVGFGRTSVSFRLDRDRSLRR